MVTVPVSDFYPTLRKIVNVPLLGIMAESIVKAAQMFCRKSLEVIYLRRFSLVAVDTQYTLIADSDLNDNGVYFKASQVLDITATDILTGDIRQLLNVDDYIIISRDVIEFKTGFMNVVVRVAVEPPQNTTELPFSLFDDYLDGICSGAASLLLTQPDSDWANPTLALYHDTIFIQAIVDARRFRLEANPDTTHMANPVRHRSFV